MKLSHYYSLKKVINFTKLELNFKNQSLKLTTFSIIALSTFLFSCSTLQETDTSSTVAQDTTKNTYVFDNVVLPDSNINSATVKEEPKEIVEKVHEIYIVQIGAFTTQEKAEVFLNKFKTKSNYHFNIQFDQTKGLYVIQLPPFTTRSEAEIVRDELRTIKELEGTFIVPNYK